MIRDGYPDGPASFPDEVTATIVQLEECGLLVLV